MMVKIFAIFELTVKKVKEPAFSILFVIAALVGYFVSGMGELTFGQNDDVLFGLIFEHYPPVHIAPPAPGSPFLPLPVCLYK